MAEHEEEKKAAFVVKDRRRFDASGNARNTEESGSSSRPAEAPRAAQPPRPEAPRPQAARPEPEPRRAAPPVDPRRAEIDAAQQEAKDAMDALGGRRGAVSFEEFILSIATNAVIHLGGDTGDGRVPPRVNLALAAQHIDMIAMIAEKTKGNLEPEEQDLVDGILYDLRMKYVAVAHATARGR